MCMCTRRVCTFKYFEIFYYVRKNNQEMKINMKKINTAMLLCIFPLLFLHFPLDVFISSHRWRHAHFESS